MPLVATRSNAGAFGLGWSAAGAAEELGGMVLLTPTSIAYTGTSATVGTNGSVEFTACSSLSLDGVFSADYDNYMISMWSYKSGGSIDSAEYRLRSSGTDSSSGYTRQYLLAAGTGVTGSRSTGTAGRFTNTNAGTYLNFEAFVFGPYLAQPTATRSLGNSSESAGVWLLDYACTHSVSNSYDGITIIVQSSTMSGLVSVYGLVGA